MSRTAFISIIALILILVALAPDPVSAQVIEEDPEMLRGIGVEEHLESTIPLDLQFVDDRGDTVALDTYFHQGKPVVLVLGYYTCPMLCNLIMNGLTDAVRELPWNPGQEYQIISASIDTTETDVVASAKKKNYLSAIGRPGIDDGWDFLTSQQNQTSELADAVGFQYYYDEDREEYAHPAVLVILTEEGKISRYLYGIQFRELDLRMALMEAADGKVGSTIDRLILYCYHYDPDAGSYVVFAGNVMKLGGGVTLAGLSLLIGTLWIRERRKKAHSAV